MRRSASIVRVSMNQELKKLATVMIANAKLRANMVTLRKLLLRTDRRSQVLQHYTSSS